MPVHWLGTEDCCSIPLVGGKAAHLSRLAREHPVPDGFVVIADETVRDELPPTLRSELTDAYGALCRRAEAAELPVAVRSSATDEDGASASFAGQYETFLNVRGIDALAQTVVACSASGGGERVVAYRRDRGLSTATGSIPVLVQTLMVADVSGVVFSADPVSGDRAQIVVNTAWGLGESVVGGSVIPDVFHVRRDDLNVVGRVISSKGRMTVAVPGGTQEVEVPWGLRERPSLDDHQLREVARLALELDQRFGWPVDVEFCWAGGDIYVLQCRAITTLGSSEERTAHAC